MEIIAVARAAHLLVYIDLLRELGSPVDQEIANSRLPSLVENEPDDFVSVRLALDFILRLARGITIAELGVLAAQRSGLALLHREFQLSLGQAATGLAKFNALVHHAERENTALTAAIARESSRIRVICDLEPFRDHPALAGAEWVIQQMMVSIGRSAAGPGWCPVEMTFMARNAICGSAAEIFAGCRMLEGQAHTSILFPIECIGGSAEGPVAGEGEPVTRSAVLTGDRFVSTLRLAIRPYLADGCPEIGLAAAIAGLSKRTLQRELARRGQTYSDVVRAARFDAACKLLGDPGVKIIDVAFETGYAHPQHFSRAFRQLAGMSPRAFRKRQFALGGQFGVA